MNPDHLVAVEDDWILADLHVCDGRYVRVCGPVGWKHGDPVTVYVWQASRDGRLDHFDLPSLAMAENLFRHPGLKCRERNGPCHFSRTEAAPR